jgi:hypothetical protein
MQMSALASFAQPRRLFQGLLLADSVEKLVLASVTAR